MSDDGSARVIHTPKCIHCDRPYAVVAEMLLHLRDERPGRKLDLERGEDLREALGEHGVDHDALDLDDPAGVDAVALCHVLSRAPRCEGGTDGPVAYGPKPARV